MALFHRIIYLSAQTNNIELRGIHMNAHEWVLGSNPSDLKDGYLL